MCRKADNLAPKPQVSLLYIPLIIKDMTGHYNLYSRQNLEQEVPQIELELKYVKRVIDKREVLGSGCNEISESWISVLRFSLIRSINEIRSQ